MKLITTSVLNGGNNWHEQLIIVLLLSLMLTLRFLRKLVV